MEKHFVVTFRFTNGTCRTIKGDGIKSVMEEARVVIDSDLICHDLSVRIVPVFPRYAEA